MSAMRVDEPPIEDDNFCQGEAVYHEWSDWSLYVLGAEKYTTYRADISNNKLRTDRLVSARCCKVCGLAETREI